MTSQLSIIHKTKNTEGQVFFMPRIYNDTMDILQSAKHYFSAYSSEDQKHLNPLQRLVYSSEMSRITLRLSSVMAWLLARRAMHEGQISMQEVFEHYKLQFTDVCSLEGHIFSDILPSYVMHLHDESLRLYQRVHALDMVETQQAA